MNESNEGKVIPLSRRAGFTTTVVGWHLDNRYGTRTIYHTRWWCRKDEVIEVMEAEKGQTHRCTIITNRGAIDCLETYEEILKKLES